MCLICFVSVLYKFNFFTAMGFMDVKNELFCSFFFENVPFFLASVSFNVCKLQKIKKMNCFYFA